MDYQTLEATVNTARDSIMNRDYKTAQSAVAKLKRDVVHTTSRMQLLSRPQLVEQGDVQLVSVKRMTSASRYSLQMLNEFCDWAVQNLSKSSSCDSEFLSLQETVNKFEHTLDYLTKQIDSSESFMSECLARGISMKE